MLKSNSKGKTLQRLYFIPFFSQMRSQVKARFCQGRRESDVHLALTGSWLDLSWHLGKERNNLNLFPVAKQYFFNHASISSQSRGLLQLYFHFEEKGDVISV
jgi:hypothetical protein